MYAHKLNVNVERDHRIAIELPDDFPSGPAEVIVLAHARAASQRKASAEGGVEDAFARLFPRDPALGPVTFHEDPTAPLGAEDWPEPSDDEAAA